MVVVSDDGGGHGGHGGHSDVGVAVVVDACVRTHPTQNKTDNLRIV